MAFTPTDVAILGYLGRALSLELSAVQQYLTLSRLLHARGLQDGAEKFRQEALGEMEHAERIIGRLLSLGVAPNASQLRPVKLGHSLGDLIEQAKVLEAEIVRFYENAVTCCIRVQDNDNRLFFEKLLAEEREHVGEFLTWQQQIDTAPARK